MIRVPKNLSLATLVLLSVAALPSLAHSQICTDCAASDVDVQFAEVGQTGTYFEQAATCGCDLGGECKIGGCESSGFEPSECESSGCESSKCGCGGRISRLRSIARALRPFGDSSGYETYRSVFGGWAELEDEGGTLFLDGVEFNDGFALGTAKGVYLNDHLRVERENTWRNNSVESINSGGTPFPLSGRINNYSTMVNVIRDFRTDCRLRPYAGLGLGASRQDGDFILDGLGLDLDVDDWAFAYQAIVGLKYVTSSRVSLFAEYRYFGNTETDLEVSTTGGPRSDLSTFEYTAENIFFGFQFRR